MISELTVKVIPELHFPIRSCNPFSLGLILAYFVASQRRQLLRRRHSRQSILDRIIAQFCALLTVHRSYHSIDGMGTMTIQSYHSEIAFRHHSREALPSRRH